MREDIIKSHMCGFIGSETQAHRMYTMNLVVVMFWDFLRDSHFDFGAEYLPRFQPVLILFQMWNYDKGHFWSTSVKVLVTWHLACPIWLYYAPLHELAICWSNTTGTQFRLPFLRNASTILFLNWNKPIQIQIPHAMLYNPATPPPAAS